MSVNIIARYILKDPNTLEIDTLTRGLKVKLDSSDTLEATSDGIRIKAESITNNHLAGNITDDKLASRYIFADGSRSFTGNQSMGGFRLVSVGSPVDAQDAATKAYVDNKLSGLKWRDPVQYSINYIVSESGIAPSGTATENEYCLNTGDNKIYKYVNGAWTLVTTLTEGDRVLYNYDGTDTSGNSGTYTKDNKIYELTSSGWTTITPEAEWALFRKVDEMGFVYDADDNKWIQFTGAGQINAGNGLYKDGNTLHVGAGDGIYVTEDAVNVKAIDLVGKGLEEDGNNNLQINDSIAGTALTIDADKVLSVVAGYGITVDSNGVNVKVADFLTSDLEDDGNNKIRIASTMAGNGLVGGSGAPLSVVGGSGITIYSDYIELGNLTKDWVLSPSAEFNIKGLKDPVDPQDAATKQFVESLVAAIHNREVTSYTITDTDIQNKYFTLPGTPDSPSSVVLIIDGAPGLHNGSAYTVSGNRVIWSGYDLDGLIRSGDLVTILWSS